MILAISATVQTDAHAQDVNALLSQWSVVTSGNLDMVNDIQGRAYIGGDVVVPNSFNTATVGSAAIPATGPRSRQIAAQPQPRTASLILTARKTLRWRYLISPPTQCLIRAIRVSPLTPH